ncbi:hypothetical protein U1Q18_005491 [Sarracenia purpurea var. burkii]
MMEDHAGGEGPTILFTHDFPELWYSWCHQMLSLSSLGYRTVAPNLRGYGDTDVPPSVAAYTVFHIVGDSTIAGPNLALFLCRTIFGTMNS